MPRRNRRDAPGRLRLFVVAAAFAVLAPVPRICVGADMPLTRFRQLVGGTVDLLKGRGGSRDSLAYRSVVVVEGKRDVGETRVISKALATRPLATTGRAASRAASASRRPQRVNPAPMRTRFLTMY